MLQAVLFDLDETLLDRSSSLIDFLDDQHRRYASPFAHVPVEVYRRRFVELDKRGYVHKSIVYAALIEEFDVQGLTMEELLADYRERCCLHARPFAGMREVLTALRAQGLRLGIVTNGETLFQQRHLDALDLPALVDAILISEQEGLRKPDPAIYRRAAERLGVEPAHCLFVGDHPQNDCAGARAVGMQAAWFPNGTVWPDELESRDVAQIECLQGVLKIVQRHLQG